MYKIKKNKLILPNSTDCFSIGNPASQATTPPTQNFSNFAYEFRGVLVIP